MDDTTPDPSNRGERPGPGRATLTARVSLTYVFDAQCPWCHAVTPTVQALVAEHPDARIDVLHGRLFPVPAALDAVGWYRPTAESVAGLTGAPFGSAFDAGLAAGGVTADSDTAAAAFVAMRAVAPDLALDIAAALHTAWFVDGLPLADLDTVIDVATSLGLSPDRVWELLANPLVSRVVRTEQGRADRLGVSTYPALFVAAGDRDVPIATRLRPQGQVEAAIAEAVALPDDVP